MRAGGLVVETRGKARGGFSTVSTANWLDCVAMLSLVKARCPPNRRLPRFEKLTLVRKSSSRRLSVGMETEMGEKLVSGCWRP